MDSLFNSLRELVLVGTTNEIREGEMLSGEENDLQKMQKNGSRISPSAIVSKDEVKLSHPVHLSPRSVVGRGCQIGKFSFLNWDTVVFPNVEIGSYCSIGRNVHIGLAKHPANWLSTHTVQYSTSYFPEFEGYSDTKHQRHLMHKPTRIGSDVWIGNFAAISSGVTIGHGSIIGAGAVVVKDVPPYSIVGGVPAKTIKQRFEDKIIEKLLLLKWWELPLESIQNLDFKNIDKCIAQLEKMQR